MHFIIIIIKYYLLGSIYIYYFLFISFCFDSFYFLFFFQLVILVLGLKLISVYHVNIFLQSFF